MSDDFGHAVHYNAVTRGTDIYGADGILVGQVERVLDNAGEHILDGIVFIDVDGVVRFADGPEVQRTYERRVELNLPASEALQLGPPESAAIGDTVRASKTRLGRMFGRG